MLKGSGKAPVTFYNVGKSILSFLFFPFNIVCTGALWTVDKAILPLTKIGVTWLSKTVSGAIAWDKIAENVKYGYEEMRKFTLFPYVETMRRASDPDSLAPTPKEKVKDISVKPHVDTTPSTPRNYNKPNPTTRNREGSISVSPAEANQGVSLHQ